MLILLHYCLCSFSYMLCFLLFLSIYLSTILSLLSFHYIHSHSLFLYLFYLLPFLSILLSLLAPLIFLLTLLSIHSPFFVHFTLFQLSFSLTICFLTYSISSLSTLLPTCLVLSLFYFVNSHSLLVTFPFLSTFFFL